MQLSQDDETNAVQVTPPSFNIVPGDWTMAPNCGPSDFVIPVSRPGFNIQPLNKTIRARVIQQALDPKRNHESLPFFLFQHLGITAAPLGLEAFFIGQAKIEVKWLRNEILGATGYVATMIRVETQNKIHIEQMVLAFVDGGYVITELTLPEATAIAEGEVISIRAAAKRAEFVILIAQYPIKVAIPIVIKIEPGSNLHVDSSILTLIVSSNTPFPSDPAFNVLRTPLTATDKQEQDIPSSCFHDRLAVLRLQPSPPQGLFVVRTGGVATPAWTLLPWEASEQPRIANVKATSATGKTIREGKSGVQVNLSVYGKTMLHSAAGQDATGILVESAVAAA